MLPVCCIVQWGLNVHVDLLARILALAMGLRSISFQAMYAARVVFRFASGSNTECE